MNHKKLSKSQARQKLEALGIREDDPKYRSRNVPVRYVTSSVIVPLGSAGLTRTLKEMPQIKFRTVPVMEMINPYRRLLNAMIDGTFTDELRKEIEKRTEGVKVDAPSQF